MNRSLFQQAAAAFDGRVALVTGGTSGIGRDIALALAREGVRVYVCGRDAERGRAVAAEAPGQVRFIYTDLADINQGLHLVRQVAEAHRHLDYLVNNAADDTRASFAEATQAQFDAQVNINLRPLFTVTQAALPLLQQGQGKAICNLVTTNYMLGLTPFTLYNATKSAIVGFSRSLAREVGTDGIRVNCVSPGWIMTAKQRQRYVTPDDERDLLRDQCLKRLMQPGDVTATVLFVLSTLAAGITGQNIVVDGGKVMQ